MMARPARRLRVAHVILKVQPTNGQYNEHCVPLARERDITVCSFLDSTIVPIDEISFFEGDGTFRGGWRALTRALEHRDHDVVHVHAPQTGAIVLAWHVIKRRSLRNAVYTIQNSYSNYSIRNRLLMVPIAAAYPAIVVCSEAARDSLPWILRFLTGRKAHVVPNAVDLDSVDAVLRDEGPLDDDVFRVVSVGRMVPIKNSETLLRAFSCLDDDNTELSYVGDGPTRARLSELIEARGLRERVRVTGFVPRADVYRYLRRADVFVSTSRGEGMPVAVLEALACGRPAVLSDIPPHRELARGAPVALVAPDDVGGFARAIDRFRRMTRAERQAIGQECRASVRTRYGIDAMHAALGEVYDLISERGGGRNGDSG